MKSTTSQEAPSGRAATLALVGLGGGVGTLMRAALAHAYPHDPLSLPTATLAVNLVGAFALGFLLGRLARHPDVGWRRRVRLAVGTGVMGGLTTYSTFMVEVEHLLGVGAAGSRLGLALAYWGGSVIAGILAATLGLVLARGSHRGERA